MYLKKNTCMLLWGNKHACPHTNNKDVVQVLLKLKIRKWTSLYATILFYCRNTMFSRNIKRTMTFCWKLMHLDYNVISSDFSLPWCFWHFIVTIYNNIQKARKLARVICYSIWNMKKYNHCVVMFSLHFTSVFVLNFICKRTALFLFRPQKQ